MGSTDWRVTANKAPTPTTKIKMGNPMTREQTIKVNIQTKKLFAENRLYALPKV
jgi:hypothetical protein